MKKIYLFSILLMGFVASSVAQNDCPSPMPSAFWYVETSNTPQYGRVIFNFGWDVGEGGGRLSIIDLESGELIPYLNTGDLSIPLQPDGGAVFIYDNTQYVPFKFSIVQVTGTITKTCEGQVLEGATTPVKLTSFTGRLQNDFAVVLDWTTAIEWDSYKYEVERSADGLHFTKVGELNAAGNSNYSVKYTFNDQLPTAGAYFYRLKQIDFNGTFENSKVVYVNSKKGAGVVTKLFPNPTRGEIQLVGATSADLQPNNLNIFSIAGQRVKYRVVGANAISLDPTAPDGVYILKMRTASGLQQFKVVKNQAAGNY